MTRTNWTEQYAGELIARIDNAIYDEIIGICKKASFYYHYEPLKKEQFTSGRIIKHLITAMTISENNPSQPAE